MNKTILIIEDELYLRDMYSYVLKKDYAIITAIDGEEALVKAKEKPDLILLDIMMPKMNGLDVLKILKSQEETKSIPVVLITNLAEKTIIQQGFQLGAQGYILKVRFNPDEVATFIKKFIDDPEYTMTVDTEL